MEGTLERIRVRPALQQPHWSDLSQIPHVGGCLRDSAPLTTSEDVRSLRSILERVSSGDVLVIQAGDCAEDINENTAADAYRKSAVLDLLAGALRLTARKPVLRVGRIAGQFAKPRSRPTEDVAGTVLPVYRGDMVNGREATEGSRRTDPTRILTGYQAARDMMCHLGWHGDRTRRDLIELPVWTSHEALLLDYELPMLRWDASGDTYLSSTHWPWVGERTRQIDGAHVALLSEVFNPVAIKVGPGMTEDEIVALCQRLDPGREAGRLTLIARMGAETVAERLPPLVEAVARGNYPVIWLTDPMHGNTILAPDGHKTRVVDTIAREVRQFRRAVRAGGGVAGGLHLETTPDDVTECVSDEIGPSHVAKRYTTLCDPRLNPRQALRVVAAWND